MKQGSAGTNRLGLIGRRSFLRAAPAAIAGSFAVPAVARQTRGAPGSQATTETLDCAE